MRKPKVVKTKYQHTVTYHIGKPGFALKQVLADVNEESGTPPSSTVVRQHKGQWLVHYMSNDSLPSITLTILDNTGQEVKFVDVPIG
jgi:hypothetical protein